MSLLFQQRFYIALLPKLPILNGGIKKNNYLDAFGQGSMPPFAGRRWRLFKFLKIFLSL